MKILAANVGALTNFEVLDYLRSRGAGKDPSRILASVSPSEFKVYDYLEKTPACNQTKEIIKECMEKCNKYKLAKAEILNIINIRPSVPVEMDVIIEECSKRFGEETEELVELVEMVLEVLPAPPDQMEVDEAIAEVEEKEEKEENEDAKQIDEEKDDQQLEN